MADRPIIFSGPMVRAILDGRKTQTRRTMLYMMPWNDLDHLESAETGAELMPWVRHAVGDCLWVRENGWERPARTERMMRDGADTWEPYVYDADGIDEDERTDLKRWGWKRRPSIFMPRWASRLTLTVTDVRVQRLQEITEEDAVAEGIDLHSAYGELCASIADAGPNDLPRGSIEIAVFRQLWDSLNARRAPWESNPWVCAISFSAEKANIDATSREAA